MGTSAWSGASLPLLTCVPARLELTPRPPAYSEWKDPQWTSLSTLRRGLTTGGDVTLRTTLFGPNAIEIEAKSIGQLLMDEVLHPFYIFQIFSIALWSVDDYYCALALYCYFPDRVDADPRCCPRSSQTTHLRSP